MNDSYDWYFAANPDEVNHVTCQEIGHVYGLGHTSTDGSSQGTCMDYSTSTNSQWPNGHDYEQLDTIYGHTDSYDTYDTAATQARRVAAVVVTTAAAAATRLQARGATSTRRPAECLWARFACTIAQVATAISVTPTTCWGMTRAACGYST